MLVDCCSCVDFISVSPLVPLLICYDALIIKNVNGLKMDDFKAKMKILQKSRLVRNAVSRLIDPVNLMFIPPAYQLSAARDWLGIYGMMVLHFQDVER